MSIWTQNRFLGPKRHALGLWSPLGGLASRSYVPSAADRVPLMGKRPFWVPFGGVNGDVAIGANQWVELRYQCGFDFIVHTLMISTSVGGTASNPGVRVQVRDVSNVSGKKTRLFSEGPCNDINFAGSARRPFFYRKPYCFRAGHTIVVRIQNLQASSNNVQVVMAGVEGA